MLITEEYRAANAHMHATKKAYGTTALKFGFAEAIEHVAKAYRAYAVLDYGSGPRKLVEALLAGRCSVRSYDPCVAELAAEPQAADLLVSCDVLEHVEPECLDAVLDHMAGLTLRAAFVTIATVPALKHLPDGRNAHLIVEGSDFWLPKLMPRWRLRNFQDLGGKLACIMEARGGQAA